MQPEGCAAFGSIASLNAATLRFDKTLNNGQTQSGPPGSGPLWQMKNIEDSVNFIGRQPGAVVGNCDQKFGAGSSSAQLNLGARRSGGRGVDQQVPNRLLQEREVRSNQ